ncbi:MAG TPA: CmcJ/NvfI family oxidoreductase [Steroidobacteraceae bacterium]|nr:CmcJ/NvfI family oxidoreductase [Steroidobacteraceae bacterium]
MSRPERSPRLVAGSVNYVAPMAVRPRFYANDHSRDILQLDPRTVRIEDARARETPASLEREGIALVAHRSGVADFRSTTEVAAVHPAEIEALILELSAADAVVVNGTGVLRFGERSPESGRLNNSRPARFIHIDCSDATAARFAERARPQRDSRPLRRFAHYNIWRTFSQPPQDVPLAVCDARSVEPQDRVPADAVFDVAGQPEWSFEGLVVRFNPGHRWLYFSNMTRDEALVFKTHDSAPDAPSQVPHSAFDDPTCPPAVPPRASIEMRAIAYWFA